MIHSQTTRIPGLRESFDLRIEMKEQLALIRDLILEFDRGGLSSKQIVLGDATLSELRKRFHSLDDETRNKLYEENKFINLGDYLNSNFNFHNNVRRFHLNRSLER